MDRYEYKLKIEQIQKLVAKKEHKAALNIVESLDWRKVKDIKTLTTAAEVYVAAHQYEDALDLLEQAYENTSIGRRVMYRMTEVAILAKDGEAAQAYLNEFKQVAPRDSGCYILEYRLAKLQGADLQTRISILETYQELEVEERWLYELAKLYAEAGRITDCVRMCDDILLWFKVGKYVDRALLLKSKCATLTANQQAHMEKMKREEKTIMAPPGGEFTDRTGTSKTDVMIGEAALFEETAEDEIEAEVTGSAEKADELPENTAENDTDEVEEAQEEKKTPRGTHRLKFPGLSWIFHGGETDDQEELEEIEETRGLEETEEIEETEESEAAEESEETEESEAAEESEETEQEILAGTETVGTKPIPETERAKGAETQDVKEEEESAIQTEDDTEWITNALEGVLEATDVPEESKPEQKMPYPLEKSEPESEAQEIEISEEEVLAMLLQDPSVQSAAETGDVFAATIREDQSVHHHSEQDMLDAQLTGQLEFDFMRLNAVAKAKEEMERELGIWDDPFRELVMQEPEEEAHIRLIFSSTKVELLQSMLQKPTEESVIEEEVAEEEIAEEATETETAETETVEEETAENIPEQLSDDAGVSEEEKDALDAVHRALEEDTIGTVDVQSFMALNLEKLDAEDSAKDESEIIAEEECMTESNAASETEMRFAEAEPEAGFAETEPGAGFAEAETEAGFAEAETEAELAEAETAEAAAVEAALMETAKALMDEMNEIAEAADEPLEDGEEMAEMISEQMAIAEKEEPKETAADRSADAWSRYNILVRTDNSRAGFELAMGYLLRLPAEERLPSVARTAGDKLNRKRWDELEEHLVDRILIVEYANEMDDACLENLRRYLTGEGHMAVLIDTEEHIAEIGLRNKPLLDMFHTEYAYYEYSAEEIVQHGLEYAKSLGWELDDIAVLAYYAAVENMSDIQPGRELIEAENIIDDAIRLAEQKTIGRLLRGAWGSKKEKMHILREVHFKGPR